MKRTHPHPKRKTPGKLSSSELQALPLILWGLAICMLVASLLLIRHYLGPAYYAIAGHPFEWSAPKTATSAASLPVFVTNPTISDTSLSPGSTQTIAVTATADSTVSAGTKVWITSPKHKQVWRSPDNAITKFTANQAMHLAYDYVLPSTLPAGVYSVSFTISSPDEYTDYVVKENFSEFTVK